jgi:hypothetical protein
MIYLLACLASLYLGYRIRSSRARAELRRWRDTVRSHRAGLEAALMIVEQIDSIRGQHAAARLDRLHLELGDLVKDLR